MEQTKTVKEWREEANDAKGKAEAYHIVAKAGMVENPSYALKKAIEQRGVALNILLSIAGKADHEKVTI